MDREPYSVPSLQRDRCAPRPVKRLALLIEARGGPGCDAPGVLAVAARADGVLVDLEVANVGPDALPLVTLQRVKPRDDVGPCSERDDVWGEDGPGRRVVDVRAVPPQAMKPVAHSHVSISG